MGKTHPPSPIPQPPTPNPHRKTFSADPNYASSNYPATGFSFSFRFDRGNCFTSLQNFMRCSLAVRTIKISQSSGGISGIPIFTTGSFGLLIYLIASAQAIVHFACGFLGIIKPPIQVLIVRRGGDW